MGKLYLGICFVLMGCFVYSQDRPKQDIRSQRIQSTYNIKDGQTTGKSYMEKQFLLDSLGRCHTEIDFDTALVIQSYQWSSFLGNDLVSRRSFVKDSLVRVDSFTYKSAGKIREHYFSLRALNRRENIIETYSYTPSNQVSKVDAKLGSGKLAYRIKFFFDKKGTEIERVVKIIRGCPADSIISLKRIPSYDSLDRIVVEIVETRYINKPSTYEQISYLYNKNGCIIEKNITAKDGNKISRTEYIFKANNTLWQEKTYNSSNTLTRMIVWRTETIFFGPKGRYIIPGM